MGKAECIKAAKEIISGRRAESISIMEKHAAQARITVPGFAEADRKLASFGSEIFRSVLTNQNIDELRARYDKAAEDRRNALVSAGYPSDYCDIKYSCSKCGDSGYIGINMCECLKHEMVKALLEDSGLRDLLTTQSFENFSLDFYTGQNRTMMEQISNGLKRYAKSFVPGKSGSMIFIGPTGLGKTHLSTAIALEVIKSGAYVIYESVINIMRDFETERFGSYSVRSAAETERYNECDLLIIDDLGCEVSNSFTNSCLYGLINERLTSHKATIISTNFTQDEIRKRYADRITSRIFGEFAPVMFFGNDIRQQKLMK